jgi:hypothetical protein
MVRTRSDNGQFITTKTDEKVDQTAMIKQMIDTGSYIGRLLLFFLIIPFFYHILVRKNILSNVVNYLDNEFGCNCTLPTPETQSFI